MKKKMRLSRQGFRGKRKVFTYRILSNGIIQTKYKGKWNDHNGPISEEWEDAIQYHMYLGEVCNAGITG